MLDEISFPITTWALAQRFLNLYASRPRSEHRLAPEDRLQRTRTFLKVLGNPQNQLKVIHIAGTTGKGSTCTFIEGMLREHGFRTGLCLSPHVMDVRERFQVNGQLISEERCIRLLNEVVQAVRDLKAHAQDLPNYCELVRGMTYLLFAQERLDYAVVETGIGGRFDSSNTVERADKFCVVTKLGLDHIHTLGETVEKIAYQKMGIVRPGSEVVIGQQPLINQSFLEHLANAEGASAVWCVSNEQRPSTTLLSSVPYLRENADLAQITCEKIAARDGWGYRSSLAESACAHSSLPLRFELFEWQGKTVILDAAHNAQKAQGLAEALQERFSTRPVALMVAFNPDTDIPATAAPLLRIASRVACVDFLAGEGDYRFRFVDPKEVAMKLGAGRQSAPAILNEWEEICAWMQMVPESLIVLTGSFHFVANARIRLLDRT